MKRFAPDAFCLLAGLLTACGSPDSDGVDQGIFDDDDDDDDNDDDNQGGAGGDFGAGGGAGGASDGADAGIPVNGGDGGVQQPQPIACFVTITPRSVGSLADVPAGPGETLKVRARSGGLTPPMPQWQWSVTYQGAPLSVTPEAADPSLLEIPIERPGRYTISARVSPTCTATETAQAIPRDQRQQHFFVRVVPPRVSRQPPQHFTVAARAGTPLTQDLTVTSGVTVRIDPASVSSIALPSYIRLSSPTGSFMFEGASSAVSPFVTRLPLQTFETLVIPQANVAPVFFFARSATALNTLPIRLSAGASISGRATGDGSPLGGVRVLLRDGPLPSTLGLTTQQGLYTARCRAGRFAIEAFPPKGSNLPVLRVNRENGALVRSDADALTLDLSWPAPPPGSLSLRVRGVDQEPLTGVTVALSLTTPTPLSDAISINGQPAPAFASLRRTGETSSQGRISWTNLPPGSYQLALTPPSGSSSARTTRSIQIADQAHEEEVTLPRRVTISGHLQPNSLAAGVQVVATADSEGFAGTQEIVRTVTGSTGQFSLKLSPQTRYQLRAVPQSGPSDTLSPNTRRVRTPLGVLGVPSSDQTVVLPNLPRGLPFSGRLQRASGQPVRGALMQVYCLGLQAGCVDFSQPETSAAVPLSEAETDSEGHFDLTLIDPASG